MVACDGSVPCKLGRSTNAVVQANGCGVLLDPGPAYSQKRSSAENAIFFGLSLCPLCLVNLLRRNNSNAIDGYLARFMVLVVVSSRLYLATVERLKRPRG